MRALGDWLTNITGQCVLVVAACAMFICR